MIKKFDQLFFKSYIPQGSKILWIAHKHLIVILWNIIVNYFFWVLLPTFLYYYSPNIQAMVPFFVLEIFIIGVFLKNIYDVFDWYCDVWIITEDGVIELDWELFSINSTSVRYASIEGIEIAQEWIINTILGKWDIYIHKIGWENTFLLKDASNVEQIKEEVNTFQNQFLKDTPNEAEWGNMEMLIEALSWVVEEYMGKNGYEKHTPKQDQEFVQKVRVKKWTIDLS